MRAVADTNVVVSGLLWRGPSRQILEAARAEKIELFTSAELIAELEEVLGRQKFLKRLQLAQVQKSELILGYAALVAVIQPARIAPVVIRDPDDDAVIACAVAARADVIITGDSDLLELQTHERIQITKAAEFLKQLEKSE